MYVEKVDDWGKAWGERQEEAYKRKAADRRRQRSKAAMGTYGKLMASREDLDNKWYEEIRKASGAAGVDVIADQVDLAPFIRSLLQAKKWEWKTEGEYTADGFTVDRLTPNMTRIMVHRGLLTLPPGFKGRKASHAVLRFPWIPPKRR